MLTEYTIALERHVSESSSRINEVKLRIYPEPSAYSNVAQFTWVVTQFTWETGRSTLGHAVHGFDECATLSFGYRMTAL